jgi:hypothetical protein
MNHHYQGKKEQYRRQGGGFRDFHIRNPRDIRHHECHGPHDGRHQMASRRSDGFYRRGKLRFIAQPLHHRDGQCPRSVNVGDHRARDSAEECARHDGYLCGAAPASAGDQHRQVDEETAYPRIKQECAEKDEQEGICGGNTERDSENSLQAQIGETYDILEGPATMTECPGNIGPGIHIKNAENDDQHQRYSNGPSRCLQYQENQRHPHDQFQFAQGIGEGLPHRDILVIYGNIRHHNEGEQRQRDIDAPHPSLLLLAP